MTEAIATPRVLVDGYGFTECPRWYRSELNFSDIHGGTVDAVTLDGAVRRVADIYGAPGVLGWLPDGQMLAEGRAP